MNPGAEMRKPLRARKTMALSSRKQAEQLSKMKAAVLAGEGAEGQGRPAAAKGLRPKGAQEELCSRETGAGPEPRLPTQEPLASLLVNSEISIYKDPQEILRDLPQPDVQRFLNAGTLQDILWYWCKKEPSSPLLTLTKGPLESGPAGQLPGASSTHENAAAEAAAEMPACQNPPALIQGESCFEVPERDGVPSGPLGDSWRKRTASSDSVEDGVLSKRSKVSVEGTSPAVEKAEARLGKVKCLIKNQLKASMRELNQGLQHLNERIDRTQCLRKHEGIAIKIVKKISRLDRHIKAVISFQRMQLSQKVKQPRARAQDKTFSGASLPPNTAVGKPPKKPTSTEILSSTMERSSGADVVPCIEVLKPSLGVLAAGAPAHPLEAAAGFPDPPGDQGSESKGALVIDLTDEESNPDTEEKNKGGGRRPLGHNSRPESLRPPARDSPDQVPPRFPHLPPLPSVEPDPAPWEELQDSPPPQKLELVVAPVNQPKGIALQWTISRVDPRCAPIESFSLFICLEDVSRGTTSEWKRTSVIKALPLPMACSLSQFPRSVKCYFTMRSKDIHGRHGPFCEVQCSSAL